MAESIKVFTNNNYPPIFSGLPGLQQSPLSASIINGWRTNGYNNGPTKIFTIVNDTNTPAVGTADNPFDLSQGDPTIPWYKMTYGSFNDVSFFTAKVRFIDCHLLIPSGFTWEIWGSVEFFRGSITIENGGKISVNNGLNPKDSNGNTVNVPGSSSTTISNSTYSEKS